MLFSSSPVYARHGTVPTSQPLASEIGLSILKRGGNAVDAAIAVASALGVPEPCSTGIGGESFLLYYDGIKRKVSGLNGSCRSASGITLKSVQADLKQKEGQVPFRIPIEHSHSVTVPGTVAGWIDSVEHWGTLPLEELLSISIKLASEGFPVGPVTSELWMALSRLWVLE
uniref:Gammaglutamyltranspeptidase putative n=1 Tax=Albugo laibachii Nc14 TaxID=890382 RepID=F0WRX7_9STRA|nr:gammaglutamyltranspeptidase putative [Albugo laibachii Nc14]|eukprot:CCA24094.1 gammaglutamyltranspeptidase putative [Albugo laibachii Nc14]